MDKYKWKNRIILVEYVDKNDKNFLNAKKKYESNLQEFHKYFVIFKKKKSKEFKIKLIGFDGTVKKIYKSINKKNIISDIKKMPMGNLVNPKNLSLYADYKPETTTPKLGFKNKQKAIYTVDKIKNRDKAYQKRVLITMINRAKYHPYKTKEMEQAIKIFEKRLKDLK